MKKSDAITRAQAQKEGTAMTIYSISGVKCYRKYNRECRTWAYIPIARWRRMSSLERSYYTDHSIIQTQAAMTGRFGYAK